MCSLTFQKNGSDAVLACEFAHDAKTIVSGSMDKTLKIWDVSSGTCQATLEGHRYLFWSAPLRRLSPSQGERGVDNHYRCVP